MYGNPSNHWEKSETTQCMNDSDEIEVVQVIRASDTKGEEEKLRKETNLKLLKSSIPRKQTIVTPKNPPKGRPLILKERGRYKQTINRKIGMTTKSPPTNFFSRTKPKESTLFSTAVKSPRGRGKKKKKLQNFPKGVERLIFNHDHWKVKDYDHLYEDFEFKDQTQSKMSKNSSKRCIYDCTVSGKITDLYGKRTVL